MIVSLFTYYFWFRFNTAQAMNVWSCFAIITRSRMQFQITGHWYDLDVTEPSEWHLFCAFRRIDREFDFILAKDLIKITNTLVVQAYLPESFCCSWPTTATQWWKGSQVQCSLIFEMCTKYLQNFIVRYRTKQISCVRQKM